MDLQDIILLIFTVSIIFGLMPILGKRLYTLPNKLVAPLYFVISIAVTGITTLFVDMPPIEEIGNYYMEFISKILDFNMLYILSSITCIFGGFGLIGGLLELVGEKSESIEVYKDYEKSARLKLYFFYLIYGYLFFFAVFAFTEFLILSLNWTFPGEESIIRKFFKYMQYENGFFILVGVSLYTIKIYRFGFLSMEFYKSEYDPKVANMSHFRRNTKKFLAFFFGSLTIFMSFVIMILNIFPNETGFDLTISKSYYFLAIILQSSFFYAFKNKFIDQLKPLHKQYEIRVRKGNQPDDTPDPFAKTKSKLEDLDDELQFD